MPIKGIAWDLNAGRDRHILRGQSSRALIEDLILIEEDGSPSGVPRPALDYFNRFSDVTLTFTPVFKRVLAGSEFVGDGMGIIVGRTTGLVTVTAGPPLRVKRNFIIEVEAKNTTGNPFRETIRMHVHGAVSQVWLTPDRLTIRPIHAIPESINSLYRFAVRAEFDDGTVGDLTERHGVVWNEPAGHADPTTGRLQLLPTDRVGDEFFVSARLPVQLGGFSTPHGPKIRIANSLTGQTTRPEIKLVAGGGLARSIPIEDSLNVLLLGDGYHHDDEGRFDSIVNHLVHHLRTNQLAKPLSLLSGRMNFWKLFIPAEERGISLRGEMFTGGIHPFAEAIPSVIKPPPDPAGAWQLPHLLYAVGLPVPGDEAAARTPAVLKGEWARMLEKDPSPNVSDELVQDWKTMAKRTLIEEFDGFPGLALGNSPTASDRDTEFLGLHSNRAGTMMLRMVLATLRNASWTLADGRPIGVLWRLEGTAAGAMTDARGYAVGETNIKLAAAGTGRFSEDDMITFEGDPQHYILEAGTPNVANGGELDLAAPGLRKAIAPAQVPVTIRPFRYRNGDFVILLSALAGGRAANTGGGTTGRYITMSTEMPRAFPVRAVPGKKSFKLEIDAPDPDVEAAIARTFTHEFCHSLGLGDEYVEVDRPASGAAWSNLQLARNAQIPDPANPGTRILSGEEIQWRWHRILAAAVVNGEITPAAAPDSFRIPVERNMSFRPKTGDTLLLRKRTWGKLIGKLGAADLSGDLVITAAPEVDAVTVRAVHLISAQDFPPGSLLYVPRPAAMSVKSPAYPYAEMVAKNIKDAITLNRKPLLDEPGPNDREQYPKVDNEDGRTPVADLMIEGANIPRIVGLYTGGDTFVSGIFHPAGLCLMRNSRDKRQELCAVCRYAMVDLVAPEFHADIDRDYDASYPLK